MTTEKSQGLPHVAAASAAEIAAADIGSFVEKRLASLIRSRESCEAELNIVSDVAGFERHTIKLRNTTRNLTSQRIRKAILHIRHGTSITRKLHILQLISIKTL